MYEQTVLFEGLYYNSLMHLNLHPFFCKSISRDKIVLLVFNTLEEPLKITAIVTVLSLLLPVDLAQKPRNTFRHHRCQKT